MVSACVRGMHGWGSQCPLVLPSAHGSSPSHRGGQRALFYTAVGLLVWVTTRGRKRVLLSSSSVSSSMVSLPNLGSS